MGQIKLDIPDTFSLGANETKRFLAAKLYESGKLTLGQAAQMAELSTTTFSELLSDFGVAFINYSANDAINDAARI